MTCVELTEPFEPNELKKLRLFSRCFKEFWDNFDDLRKKGLSLNASLSLGRDGRVHGGTLRISRHRLKGFFVDYRLFHLQREPTNFRRICGILKRRCRNQAFRQVLDKQYEKWEQPEVPIVGWHNAFSVSDVIDSYFDEELFHLGRSKKSDFALHEVRQKLSDDALMLASVYIVYERLLVLRNVNWLLAPVLNGESFLRLPNT